MRPIDHLHRLGQRETQMARPAQHVESSIASHHAIGACADDTANLDCLFPVLPARSYRGEPGYAVHAYNSHSRVLQPVGTWFATEAAARAERDQILELLDSEAVRS